MATSKYPGVGRIAEKDDIAPEGTVVTEAHVKAYEEACNKAFPDSFPDRES